MKSLGFTYIRCPNCGAEYLPSEIYFPKSFFGNPGFVVRDENNKIVSFSGDNMQLDEQYKCDHCNTVFKVTAKINFTSTEIINYDTSYSTSIKKPSLFLQEN